MLGRWRYLLAVAIFAVAVGFVVISALVSEDSQTPEDLVALLQPGRDEATFVGSSAYPTLRQAAIYKGVTLFVGIDGEGSICLIAHRTDGQRTGAGTACRSPDRFAERGLAIGMTDEDGFRILAYLLPDGYQRAAASLPWAAMLSPNLIAITDFDAYELAGEATPFRPTTTTDISVTYVRQIELDPDTSGQPTLSLDHLGGGF
jgi:hypothetical protein